MTGFGLEGAEEYAQSIGIDLYEELQTDQQSSANIIGSGVGDTSTSSNLEEIVAAEVRNVILMDQSGNRLTDNDGNYFTTSIIDENAQNNESQSSLASRGNLFSEATVAHYIGENPKEIANMAAALVLLAEGEIARMMPLKPNDIRLLENWQTQVDFLFELSQGLRALHSSVLKNEADGSGAGQQYEETVSVVAGLRRRLGEWISSNSSEVIDSTSRIAFMGMSTSFPGLCGAPVDGAFYVSAALTGGLKLSSTLSDLMRQKQSE